MSGEREVSHIENNIFTMNGYEYELDESRTVVTLKNTTSYGSVVVATVTNNKFKLENRYIIVVSDSNVQRACTDNGVTWDCDEHLDTTAIDLSKVGLYVSEDGDAYQRVTLQKSSGNGKFVVREQSAGTTRYMAKIEIDGENVIIANVEFKWIYENYKLYMHMNFTNFIKDYVVKIKIDDAFATDLSNNINEATNDSNTFIVDNTIINAPIAIEPSTDPFTWYDFSGNENEGVIKVNKNDDNEMLFTNNTSTNFRTEAGEENGAWINNGLKLASSNQLEVSIALNTKYTLEYYVHLSSSTSSLLTINGAKLDIGTISSGYNHIAITLDDGVYTLYINGSVVEKELTIDNIHKFGINGSDVTVYSLRAYKYALDSTTINVNYKVYSIPAVLPLLAVTSNVRVTYSLVVF